MALWPFALNALVGLDLGSAMSEEADAPRRDIPRSLLTGGVAVAACYLLTYGAVMLIAIGEPSAIYGHVASVNSVIAQSGTDRSLAWLASAIVLVELAGLMGSGAAWLSAPARIPFAIGIDRYLPNIFARVHPRFGTPYMALIVQAIAATALIFANTYGATLQDAYLVLVGGSIVLVMVPYLYLLAAWMKLTASSSVAIRRVKLLGATGSVATCAAIAACFIPPPLVEGVLGFEVKLIGSVGFMLACGLAAYKLGARRGAKFSASRQSTDNSSMP
jgi:amino acid transporter